MQTVKWSKAFFHLDMNIFQIFTGITKFSIEAPSCPKDFTMESPRMYSIAAPDISSIALWVVAAVFFTVSADPLQSQRRKSNADNGNNRSNGAEEDQA